MNIIIDGKTCKAEKGEYILDIAKRNNIYIPTLCHNDALPGQGNCRLCIVEVIDNNWSKIVTSCIYPVTKEVEVITNSDRIRKLRKGILMLLSARVPENECINELMEEYGVLRSTRFVSDENEDCILCGLCVRACEEVGSSAISTVFRGLLKDVSTPYDEPSPECIGCGSCAYVCPTKAIKIQEYDGKRTIWNKTFDLLKCSKCGRYFATREQLDHIGKKLNTDIDSSTCDKCKRSMSADKLKDAYENVMTK